MPTTPHTLPHLDATPNLATEAPEGWPVQSARIHMLGIGGCGMSGLARMLKARGAFVDGSDKFDNEATAALRAEGIAATAEPATPGLPEDCDLVIASAAIKPDHPQMLEAQRRGLRTLTYAEALGRCMLGRSAVALAGTHGKSTTTAMLGTALVDSGLDPSVVVGATCAQLVHGALAQPGSPAGFRLGSDRIPCGELIGRPGVLIAEACEFNRSFHNYRPFLASISSVEADHLDIYGTFEAVVQSFNEFAKLVAPANQGGLLLIAHDGAHRKEVTAGVSCAVQTIGFSPDADWVVSHDPITHRVVLSGGAGHAREKRCEWLMRIPGAHNAMNAATAAALALSLGADPLKVGLSLSNFTGVDRRTQFLGTRSLPDGGKVRVYDDYGHHPTEIDVTLRALRAFERPEEHNGRLICVFQPHQHSRTRFLLNEFVNAFGAADLVLVPDIYFVRDSEAEKQKISSTDLVDRLRARHAANSPINPADAAALASSPGPSALHLHTFNAIVEHLESICRPGDLVVVMGAGPVNQVAHAFLASDHA